MPKSNKGIINTGTIGGNATVKNESKHIGDAITVNADHSVVNIKGRMENISFNLDKSKHLSNGEKEEFEAVATNFISLVQSITTQKPEEAEKIMDYFELLSKELGRDKPKKDFLQSMWTGIKQTIGVIGDSLPEIVGACSKIEKILAKWVV